MQKSGGQGFQGEDTADALSMGFREKSDFEIQGVTLQENRVRSCDSQ